MRLLPRSWFRKRDRAASEPQAAAGAATDGRREEDDPDRELSDFADGLDAKHVDRIALLLLAAGDVRDPTERLRMGVQLAAMLPRGALPIIGEAMERAVEMSRMLNGGGPRSAPAGTTKDWN